MADRGPGTGAPRGVFRAHVVAVVEEEGQDHQRADQKEEPGPVEDAIQDVTPVTHAAILPKPVSAQTGTERADSRQPHVIRSPRNAGLS
jgi:hypothetical protein